MDSLQSVIDLIRERDEVYNCDLDTIQSVVDLIKDRESLDLYNSWFQDIVGESVNLRLRQGKGTYWVSCKVTQFIENEGWELMSNDDDETVYRVDIWSFFSGDVQLE
jgi:hypothetical protein